MSSKLIQLKDGVLVEVEAPASQSRELSGSFADKVNANIDKIKPILTSVTQPILATWDEIKQNVLVDQAEVELGLSFDIEGNVYIAKTSVSANITIRLVLKPVSNQMNQTS
jgi:hypothetical protein